MENLYVILCVLRTATDEEIKRAYKLLAHKNHPDKGGDIEEFRKIQKAYEVLSDFERRKQYDETGNYADVTNEDLSLLATFIRTAMSHINQSNFFNADIFAVVESLIDSTISQTESNIRELSTRITIESHVLSKIKKRDTIFCTVIAGNLDVMSKNIEGLTERLVILNRVKDLFMETKDPKEDSDIQQFISHFITNNGV